MIGTTLAQFLIEEQRKHPSASGDLTLVINDIATGCKAIATTMRYGALSDADLLGVSTETNVQGETQKTLDILANEVFLRRTEFGGHLAGMVSEEMESVYQLPDHYPKGNYLLLYDPVDGSSNIGDYAVIGTIFSILKRPDGASGRPTIDEFLQPGTEQVCAGYAVYGPSCMVVMTTGNGVNGFTLDPALGEFTLTHRGMRIPAEGTRFCANLTHFAEWDEPIRSYVADALWGRSGERRDLELRYSGCFVADVHRLLTSGGIYMNPVNESLRRQSLAGRLRLLYEVNPMSLIVEQAGGRASTGEVRALDVEPESLHQRSPVILGSRSEVDFMLSNYLGEFSTS